ncbi:MAG: hypothetical protein K2L87_01095 [Clostridiales bacterium]|nr:hypothetical protein [Clostridiales bacterium]
MKSVAKKLSLLLVLMVSIIACFTLFACGEDEPTETGYAVYVKMPDGSAATGVMVQTCVFKDGRENDPAPANPDEDDRLESCNMPVPVDANGKYAFDDDGKTYAIHIMGLPTGHTYTVVNVGPNNKVVTITLVKE